jgi:glycosyltransferase involved in cell wall biosynthesis
VPAGDDVKLAEAMVYLLDNPDKADKMGEKAQELRLRLAPEKVFSQWLEYINSYLEK